MPDQNAALVRAANMAHRYTGNPRQRELAIHGMKYLAAIAASREGQLLPEVLLEDRELSIAPIHITIVEPAAAFACADGACSNPVYQAGKIEVAVRRALLR